MGAQTTVVFLGVRIEIPESQVEELETQRHPTLLAARTYKLDHYWGEFGSGRSQSILLIGKRIALIGIENDLNKSIAFDELEKEMKWVAQRLIAIDINDEPRLYIEFIPDI